MQIATECTLLMVNGCKWALPFLVLNRKQHLCYIVQACCTRKYLQRGGIAMTCARMCIAMQVLRNVKRVVCELLTQHEA